MANLRGVKKEGVGITTNLDSIMISARTEEEKDERKDNYSSRERRAGRFMRSLTLSVPVDVDKAEATFADDNMKYEDHVAESRRRIVKKDQPQLIRMLPGN